MPEQVQPEQDVLANINASELHKMKLKPHTMNEAKVILAIFAAKKPGSVGSPST